jgi:hypothetical protein
MIMSSRYVHASSSHCNIHGSINILDWRMEADPTHSEQIVESPHQAVNGLMILSEAMQLDGIIRTITG